mgnify:CR=1 FL=1
MTALTRLSLTDFRNYASLSLNLDGRHVCLFGANGAGKTNLLEAVSQLGPPARNGPQGCARQLDRRRHAGQ